MGRPAAKAADAVEATDNHVVLIPSPSGTTPTDQSLPFAGVIDGGLCDKVLIQGRPAAVVGSTATNTPPHVPIGGTFANPPTNQAQIVSGSSRVLFQGRPAARDGDTALTCNDPAPEPVGRVIAESTVLIGD